MPSSNRASPVAPVIRASAPGDTPAITARAAVIFRPSASSTPVARPPEWMIRATGAAHSTVPPRAVMAATSARMTVSAPPLPSTIPKLWFAMPSR